MTAGSFYKNACWPTQMLGITSYAKSEIFLFFSHYSQMKEKCIFEMLWQFKFRRAQHLKVKTSSIKSKSGAKVWRVKLHN